MANRDTIRSFAWDYRPVPVFQDFNVYNADADAQGWYDYVTAYGLQKGHHGGIDVGVERGTVLRSLHTGTVTFAGFNDSFRPFPVYIQPEDDPNTQIDESQYEEIWGHLEADAVQTGQHVTRGQKLGLSGEQTLEGPNNTGKPDGSGPHLHFELRQKVPVSDQFSSGQALVDPWNWLTESGDNAEPSHIPNQGDGSDQGGTTTDTSDGAAGIPGIIDALQSNAKLVAVLALGAGLVLVGAYVISR